MTEDEAKTKWCPFARVAVYTRGGFASDRSDPVVVNRDSTDTRTSPDGATGCLGSGCMAWRWTDLYSEPDVRVSVSVARQDKLWRGWTAADEAPDLDGDDSNNFIVRLLRPAPSDGRCGIASEPDIIVNNSMM